MILRIIRLSILCLAPCCASLCAQAAGSIADPRALTTEIDLNPPPAPLPSIEIGNPKRVIATVNDQAITLGMIEQPVIDLYGLNQLLLVAKREYYRQMAANENITITKADELAARDRIIEQAFSNLSLDDFKGTIEEQKAARKAEMEKLFPQLLARSNVALDDFDRSLFNQAVLWKIAEKQTVSQITEDHLKQVFGIKYGEKVAVRHIQVATHVKAMEVLQRLRNGEKFEDIAAKESLDVKSRPYGGEVRAFTRDDPIWKPAFRDTAFSLKEEGEISGEVSTGEIFEVIQLVKRIPPSIIKFEDVRDDVRAELTDLVIHAKMETLKQEFDFKASNLLKISDPALEARFKRMIDSVPKTTKIDDVRDQIHEDDAPAGATGSEVAQPPATRPGQ
jgi:parvulin-like peptidyl-prolyl isomerase